MNSLKTILNLKPETIYPGHGPVVKDGINRVEQYIQHRNKRNEQILETLKNSKSKLSVEQLVRLIYIVIKIYYEINK